MLDWISDDKNLSISHLMLGSVLLELFCYSEFKKTDVVSLDDDLKVIGVKHFALLEEVRRVKYKLRTSTMT